MSLPPGTRLGPYEILAALGAGGMGEVYRARDTRLNREVALKVLPEDFACDPARRQRFEQEARTVAALNHPNIVAVYDVGENFLVSELIDGQTLRAAGRLSPRQAIDFAVQIAEGLAAAHAAGIAHRDLKPENLMLARDGRAKILDFGLAKVTQPPASGTEAPTQTQDGMILGTVGYMSPEQVKGLPADHRSDIFSFGLVLYEMLASRRAFSGGSSIEVLSAILKEDPPELPESIAPGLRRIVEHCLDKNPDRRFQSARDLAFALQAPLSSGPHAVPARTRRWRSMALIAAGALAVAVVSVTASRFFWRTPEPPSWTGSILGGAEIALNPRLSPDGNLLAFQAMVDGLSQVAVMKPESGNWSIRTRDREHGFIFNISWSSDGAAIYYDRLTDAPLGIFSVPVLGGEEHLVVENASSPETLPDGSLLIVKLNAEHQRQLHRFWPGTGRLQALPARVTSLDTTTPVRAFPDGKAAVVVGEPIGETTSAQALYTVDLASGSMKRLGPPAFGGAAVTAFVPAPDGQSVWAAVHSGALTTIASVPASGAAVERPLFTATNSVWYLDAGPNGNLYAAMVDRPVEVARFSPDGSRFEKLASFPQGADSGSTGIMSVLSDGRAVLPVRASGQFRLMVVQKGKDPEPLVNTSEETAAPIATCGPHEVAFMIGPEPHETIAFAEPTTGRVVRKIAPAKGSVNSLSCSPDGKTLYFAARDRIWSIPSSGSSTGREARNIRAGDSVVADSSGRRLIIQAQDSSGLRLFSLPLDGGPEHEIPLDNSAPLYFFPLSPSALSTDGRLLKGMALRDSWFNHPAVLDTATGRITRIPSDNESDHLSMGWTKDGQVIAVKIGLRSMLWKFQPASR